MYSTPLIEEEHVIVVAFLIFQLANFNEASILINVGRVSKSVIFTDRMLVCDMW